MDGDLTGVAIGHQGHGKLRNPVQPADATGTSVNKPNAKPYSAPPSSVASTPAPADPLAHMDSVLTDPYNQLHYSGDEIFKAKQDSANLAGNIDALNQSPASGAGTIVPTTPTQRMAARKIPPVPKSLAIPESEYGQ